MDKRITNAIAIIALLLWVVSFVLDAVLTNYEPPISVHIVMMTVAGAAFGGSVLKKGSELSDAMKDKGEVPHDS